MDCLEQCRGKQDTEDDERMHRPFYTSRHPPLVQPLHLSLFTERTRKKYGAPDLAHEWIALFQMISGSPLERSISPTRGLRSSMKMNVPDTVFLSPTGQPSIWYRTCSSRHIKARHLAHVTPKSIGDSLFLKQEGCEDARCAILYRGFDTTILDTRQLEELVSQMDHACIPSPTKCHVGGEDDSSDCTEVGLTSDADEDKSPPFCIQQFIQRAQDVSFLCLWRQYTVSSAEMKRPNANAHSRVKATDNIFLVRRSDEWNERMNSTPRDMEGIMLERLELDGDDEGPTRRKLNDVGFDGDAVMPSLLHIRLHTSEIVGRMNRACGSSRQVESLACEFFLRTEAVSPVHTGVTYSVFFSALAGIQWQGHVASWETLRGLDAMSRAIYDTVSISSLPGAPRRRRYAGIAVDTNSSLALFDELNPRFPSVLSPCVTEKQWKHKAALLPPYVSPRYVNAEIPKVYREGQFQPLLSPRQCYAVNLLHTIPSSFTLSGGPRHPLSKKHADVENELWVRQDVERVARGLQPRSPLPMGALKPSPQALGTRRSPRQRHSIIKEELA